MLDLAQAVIPAFNVLTIREAVRGVLE